MELIVGLVLTVIVILAVERALCWWVDSLSSLPESPIESKGGGSRLPSGPVTPAQMQAVFGDNSIDNLTEYYRGGPFVP